MSAAGQGLSRESWLPDSDRRVAAVDPSESFVAAVRERQPGVDARHAAAERLPFGAETFDATLAQLVVHFGRTA